jgi:23S rRNA (uracil1939-C5)-methyltransferase
MMELTIERLIYGGDGLARQTLPGEAQGKAIFVPFVLPGERVEATLLEEKPGFARARADRILSPSAERVPPPCPYFSACGGCHYQHSDYGHQLVLKSSILRETLRRTARIDWQGNIVVHPSPPWNYRNRTRMKLRADPFALGYYKFRSHELLPVEQCPISSQLINRAISGLWTLGRQGAFGSEFNIAEIEFLAAVEDDLLMLQLHLSAAPQWREDGEGATSDRDWARLAGEIRQAIPELSGIALLEPGNEKGSANRPISRKLPPNLKQAFGAQEIFYKTRAAEYRVSCGSFFQTNRFLTDELVELATAGLSGRVALDLYAGVGLFSVALARSFARVTAVESAAASYRDLRRNSPTNVEAHNLETEKFLAGFPSNAPSGAGFDYIVVDPPRAGLGDKVTRRIAVLRAPRITYVSCDPATLSRDLKILLESGYRIEQVHLVDLFPQTYHLESVVQLAR